MFSSPNTFLCLPGLFLVLYRLEATTLYSISFTKLLLPLPDTPVTHIN